MGNKGMLLIIGAGREAVPGLHHLRELGYKLFVVDGAYDAPGLAYADHSLIASVYNPSEVIHRLKQHSTLAKQAEGVMAMACDAVRTVAEVARLLSIPGPTVETARLATDKLAMKQRLREHGIAVPDFWEIYSAGELKELCRQQGFPLIIKPVDSRGARGVIRLNNDVDLCWAFQQAIAHTTQPLVLVERWIDGPQLSTESVVWDDSSLLCAVADRNYERLDETFPYVIEDGGRTPSRYSPELDETLDHLLRQTAHAIGLRRGTIKGDVVLTQAGPMIIEVAARLSGGDFSTITIPEVYGIDIVGLAARVAVGERPPLESIRPKAKCFQANRFLFLPPGAVRKIHRDRLTPLQAQARKLELNIFEGQGIQPISDHTHRLGTVMTLAMTADEAEQKAASLISNMSELVELER